MKEIIGENLSYCMDYFDIKAKRTLSKSIGYWPHFEVWELSDEEYNKMCDITDEQWIFEESWWRGCDGSNLGVPNAMFIVNNHRLLAWESECVRDMWFDCYREDCDKFNSWSLGKGDFQDYCKENGRYRYSNLLNYMCNEHGVSTEKNVCALATDLAKYNNITMAALFDKYEE